MFIISIDSESDLPDYFRDEFKSVSLDGKGVDVAESEEDRVGILVEGKGKDAPLYKKTPVSAKWQDITMAFPNHLEDKVDIIFNGKEDPTVSLKNCGVCG